MFSYLKKKLGIVELQEQIVKQQEFENEIYHKLSCLLNILKTPTPDDSLIMFHLRCMGYAGGWKVKNVKIPE